MFENYIFTKNGDNYNIFLKKNSLKKNFLKKN